MKSNVDWLQIYIFFSTFQFPHRVFNIFSLITNTINTSRTLIFLPILKPYNRLFDIKRAPKVLNAKDLYCICFFLFNFAKL